MHVRNAGIPKVVLSVIRDTSCNLDYHKPLVSDPGKECLIALPLTLAEKFLCEFFKRMDVSHNN